MIFQDRVKELNNRTVPSGEYVLYWMQASQRVLHNHALEYGILRANELERPLVVYFGLKEDYPEATERHFRFMLEGLSGVARELRSMGIGFIMKKAEPWKGALELSKEASLVVCDRGYLGHQVRWRRDLSSGAECPVVQVESDVVIPVEAAADREMYSAGTLRPKINRILQYYLETFRGSVPKKSSLDLDLFSLDPSDPGAILTEMRTDRSVGGGGFIGGTENGLSLFSDLMERKLDTYHTGRNDPSRSIGSDMSPYLHFGQISPVTLASMASEASGPGVDAFLEQLIVRRELSMNFVLYNKRYDTFECLPAWAQKTLTEHQSDRREHVYSRDELEGADTHDPYWNAAQKEMAITGKMHGYMRMYWGKKVIEWTEDPRDAYRTLLYLNNRYSLDGRDPNSYAGVAWCFGKHDRAWGERPVFGKVRYMNDKGLKRKFDIGRYVESVR